jgi:hypothetical protein
MIMVLKPTVPGVTVRDPSTGKALPDEGRAVVMTTFWRRRLKDGSVVEALPEPTTFKKIKTPHTPTLLKEVKESGHGLT